MTIQVHIPDQYKDIVLRAQKFAKEELDISESKFFRELILTGITNYLPGGLQDGFNFESKHLPRGEGDPE